MTRIQTIILMPLLLIGLVEISFCRDVFASVALNGQMQFHDCVERMYGMAPVRSYIDLGLYPTCQTVVPSSLLAKAVHGSILSVYSVGR